MQSSYPRGNETNHKSFTVEPCYATGSDKVSLAMHQPGVPYWYYRLTRAEAIALRDALVKVLEPTT